MKKEKLKKVLKVLLNVFKYTLIALLCVSILGIILNKICPIKSLNTPSVSKLQENTYSSDYLDGYKQGLEDFNKQPYLFLTQSEWIGYDWTITDYTQEHSSDSVYDNATISNSITHTLSDDDISYTETFKLLSKSNQIHQEYESGVLKSENDLYSWKYKTTFPSQTKFSNNFKISCMFNFATMKYSLYGKSESSTSSKLLSFEIRSVNNADGDIDVSYTSNSMLITVHKWTQREKMQTGYNIIDLSDYYNTFLSHFSCTATASNLRYCEITPLYIDDGVSFNNIYTQTDQQCYDRGYDEGLQHGSVIGYSSGYTDGLNVGYTNGKSDGNTINSFDINKSMISLAEIPLNLVKSMTNFEVFGVSLFGIISGLFTLVLAIWIIRKVK